MKGPYFVRNLKKLKVERKFKEMQSATQTSLFNRRVLLSAVLALVCAPSLFARGDHAAKPVHQAAHSSAPAPQNHPNQGGNPYRPGPANQTPSNQGRPAYAPNGNGYPNAARPGQPYGAPATPLGAQFRPYYNSNTAPPGHLGDWLNQHRGQPVEQQERMLRSDPNFNRLPAGDQQRLLQQLHRVNQLPDDQRDRRLARAEMIEHLSPQQRMQVSDSFRRLGMLSPDRRSMISNAFRDLRAVPPDQRAIVLNSSRYQSQFSPDERGMLNDMLRVEPYEPTR